MPGAQLVMRAVLSSRLVETTDERNRVISPLINLWDRLRHAVYRAFLWELPLHGVPSMLGPDFVNGLFGPDFVNELLCFNR
jgi:hypothetical protein